MRLMLAIAYWPRAVTDRPSAVQSLLSLWTKEESTQMTLIWLDFR